MHSPPTMLTPPPCARFFPPLPFSFRRFSVHSTPNFVVVPRGLAKHKLGKGKPKGTNLPVRMDKFSEKFGLSSSSAVADVGQPNSPATARSLDLRVGRSQELKIDDEGIHLGQGCLEDDTASVVTAEDLKAWQTQYKIPKHVELQVPNGNGRADEPRNGWFALHEIFLMVWLKFPLPRLTSDALSHFEITIEPLINPFSEQFATAIRHREAAEDGFDCPDF